MSPSSVSRTWARHFPAVPALLPLVMWFNYDVRKGFLVEGCIARDYPAGYTSQAPTNPAWSLSLAGLREPKLLSDLCSRTMGFSFSKA